MYIVRMPKALGTRELLKWLKPYGVVTVRQSGSHLRVRRGDRFSTIPVRKGGKTIPTGTLLSILRDLDITDRP